ALGLEAGDDLTRVHAGLEDFQRDLAADGLLLLSDKDQAHAPRPDLLHQPVRPDDRAGTLPERWLRDGAGCGRGRGFEEAAELFVFAQQDLDALTQVRVAGTGFLQQRRALGSRRLPKRRGENLAFVHSTVSSTWEVLCSQCVIRA